MKIKSFLENLDKIAKEKDTSKENIVNILKTALEKSYLKENPDLDIEVVVDLNKESIKLFEKRVVVDKSEDEIDDDKEINISEAQELKKSYKLGDTVSTEVNIDKFERRITSHFAQILTHNLNDISNSKVYEEWKDKVGNIIRAEVEKVDNRLVEVNLGSTKGVVLRSEQIPGEELQPGQSYLFLIKEVKSQQTKGWPIILSRADEGLLRYLLKTEISEISDGIIEIKRISRIVGYKTKVAILSRVPGVDAVGTAVGPKGERIKKISSTLNNERIDVILYDEDPKQFLVNACHPEKIVGVEITDDEDIPGSKIVTIVCPEESLIKLIGKNGINVRLLSKLTGWSIDIISEKLAIEDKIEFEDVSQLVSSKTRQPRSQFGGYRLNNANNKKSTSNKPGSKPNFYSGFSSDDSIETDFDIDQYKAELDSITDDDVEQLLNTNTNSSSRKNKKQIEDDEEVVFYESSKEKNDSQDSTPVTEEVVNDQITFKYKEEKPASETKSKKEKPAVVSSDDDDQDYEPVSLVRKDSSDIDDIGGDDPWLLRAKKENKSSKSKNYNKAPKPKKEKVSVFDELMDNTDDISVDSEIDTSELDNLELEDE
ncbi:transcription termination/antitermination protein NusA [Malacoplasma penetrans]|uniref:Transcription termination/antitermination protein NusA n=1 Tax=Malacoplasma penetrans (strain HF-2) TaxID=272633 RepID=Q8EWU2_MALP2|nr:transcription termination factor NusA [Malacoplasma penetrans]RXY97316.1 transcription termination/antitermination protein NusA [Malacoplasma penetrans]BAC43901.1 N-utilization substance protein A [Malacoplasma penetrans HF-2]